MSTRFFGIEKPSCTDAGCWVVLRSYGGSLWAQGVHCGLPARKGLHTCRHHSQYEGRAVRVEVTGRSITRSRDPMVHQKGRTK